ncbi:MAG: hypothetical protein M1819_000060 [Sarea resinae]|nr:MAG: hypothetical protein M1819_000060 [Sarea resinae]
MAQSKQLYLFGGDKPWNAADWIASDDRVRGGSSQSYLDVSKDATSASFNGTLDTETLGGAGFASQRTTSDELDLDLEGFDGVEVEIGSADDADEEDKSDKRYTLILKDTLLPPNLSNGREQATISYEYDFRVPQSSSSSPSQPTLNPATTTTTSIFIPFASLTPTYRGREQKDAPALNLAGVKRVSIMMRSFFDEQSGPFAMDLVSISATSRGKRGEKKDDEEEKERSKKFPTPYRDADDGDVGIDEKRASVYVMHEEKVQDDDDDENTDEVRKPGLWDWLCPIWPSA